MNILLFIEPMGAVGRKNSLMCRFVVQLWSSFRIPYHTGFQWGHLKNGPYTYTASGGNVAATLSNAYSIDVILLLHCSYTCTFHCGKMVILKS